MASAETEAELRLQGIGVSPGIARARILFAGSAFEEPELRTILPGDVESELNTLQTALTRTREQLREVQREIDATVDREHASIFDAHLLVLEDTTVNEEVIRLIETEHKSADRAYWEVIHGYLESLRKISDPYLRERAIDIEDVARRVLRCLRPDFGDGIPVVSRPCILLAHDLRPSDTVALNRELVLGFATEAGSPTSHTAIMARSLNIPAVVGLHEVLHDTVHPGDDVLLDGYHGLVIVRPGEETLVEYEKFHEREVQLLTELTELRERETLTAEGRKIILSANIEFVEELKEVREQGAEGIGLYRTEFFFLNDAQHRSEERQTENYTRVTEGVKPHGVIIRTLDIGGDKLWPEHFDEPDPNPFLGWRGIRISISRPEVFKTQARAILRASAHGKTGLMYPFISSVEEVREANRLLDEVRSELDGEGVKFDPDMEVGAMIEIPSAAFVADAIAKEVDFFSIGTNDLTQYTTAVDRVNDRVAHLYQPLHPGVLQLIRRTVIAAKENGIWVGICGEVAGDPVAMPIIVGTEVDELSIGASQILRIRRAISRLETDECRELLDQALTFESAGQVHEMCHEIAKERYPELID